MSTRFFIEPGAAAHAHVLAALHRQCFKDHWSAEAISTLLATPGAMAFIASDQKLDQPVGFILVRIVADEGEVLSIGVLEHARSRGAGAALIAKVATTSGLRSLFLEVAADNQRAVELYTRTGFEVVGRRPGYYARGKQGRVQERVDALTMKCALHRATPGDKRPDCD